MLKYALIKASTNYSLWAKNVEFKPKTRILKTSCTLVLPCYYEVVLRDRVHSPDRGTHGLNICEHVRGVAYIDN